jgi:hypothetical protein
MNDENQSYRVCTKTVQDSIYELNFKRPTKPIPTLTLPLKGREFSLIRFIRFCDFVFMQNSNPNKEIIE